ncbi:MAG: UDP-N-acetylmuramate dehydrogenase [Lachnospiraceae bacterium]|nr:UDP-N-acetylmuramate dehydrogenase [Lachnospiraceae bacterium]
MWNEIADKRLAELIPENRVLRDEPMYKHTTFKVGGPATVYVTVNDEDELIRLLDAMRDTGADCFIIGHGSNILVSDKGYDGLMIETVNMSSECKVEGNSIRAGAGMMLGHLAITARDNSLAGLEFAAGIPGTVGGAVYMNAGAYGGEIKDVIRLAGVYDRETGKVFELTGEELNLSYRHSVIKERGYVVLYAVFDLIPGDRKEIEVKINDYNCRRREKQPLEYPSAGSTFKRPEGFFAGALIQESGLKGYSVGDAKVSDKHAGFVINKGHATATDIYCLIREVREKVYADTGVMLEPEVELIGDFA